MKAVYRKRSTDRRARLLASVPPLAALGALWLAAGAPIYFSH